MHTFVTMDLVCEQGNYTHI